MKTKNYIKWTLKFTTSKLLSYLIFIVGSVVAFHLKSSEVFVNSCLYAAALQGVKAAAEGYKKEPCDCKEDPLHETI